MMHPLPLISVIILNWNGKECLCPCIRSIMEQSYPNTEILVVDNASTDGSLEEIRSFDDLRLIANAENLGYGGGNNRGIEAARGEYIFVLNNDTEIERQCVESLWKELERDGKIGMTTPKILFYDRRDVIDAAGLTVYPDGLSIGRGHSHPQEGYNEREEVFSGSGCASLLRKEMLDEIGLYDEDFFAYAEDTDLGWRARLAGWRASYVPEAIVYHHHSRKFGAYSERKAFLVERNRIWVALKNFPPSLLCLVPFYTLIRYFYQGFALWARRGASGKFREGASPFWLILAVLKAFLSGLAGLPSVLRKRKQIQSKKRISNRECFRILKKYGIKAKEIAYME